MNATGLEAILLSNRKVSFNSKEGETVSYHELSFLIEDKEGNAKLLIVRPKDPDIKTLVPTFTEMAKGDFVYGNLIVEYNEVKTPTGVFFRPKYVSFNAGKKLAK